MYKSALLRDGISVRVLCARVRLTPQDAAVFAVAATVAAMLRYRVEPPIRKSLYDYYLHKHQLTQGRE